MVPVEDMSDLAASRIHARARSTLEDEQAPRRPPSIWPHVENQILDLISDHRSTIVFANSRRLAERLTAHLNELQAERLGEARRAVRAAGAGDGPVRGLDRAGTAAGHR